MIRIRFFGPGKIKSEGVSGVTVLLVCGQLMQKMARSLVQRIELATDRGSNTKNMQALNRLGRFLKGSPRCLVVFNRQAEQPIMDVFSDSDCAGCAKTRRPTSSSYVMLGGHLSLCRVGNNSECGKNSGETEFYELTKSTSRALGAPEMLGRVQQTS